jgi:hypothetical protein
MVKIGDLTLQGHLCPKIKQHGNHNETEQMINSDQDIRTYGQ